jgi:hypothetical protein
VSGLPVSVLPVSVLPVSVLPRPRRHRHDGRVDADRILALRGLLEGSGWVERTRDFARSMRTSTRHEGGLMLVGTPAEEPWHLAAHLSDESRLADIPELMPTLVRWAPPSGAPAHLAVDMSRIERAARGETLVVVAPEDAPHPLLERLADARKVGATILAIDAGDEELEGIAHEAMTVPHDGLVRRDSGLVVPASASFDVVQHLVSSSVVDDPGAVVTGRGLRGRMAKWLEAISGPAPSR